MAAIAATLMKEERVEGAYATWKKKRSATQGIKRRAVIGSILTTSLPSFLNSTL